MMTRRRGTRLEGWIIHAEQDTPALLASFARNLRRDFDAVRNGRSLHHSSGAVEGNVNRLILWNLFRQAESLRPKVMLTSCHAGRLAMY